MTDKEKLMQEMLPHINSGLLVIVLETESFTIFRLANTGYVLFLHGLYNPTNNTSVGFNLIGKEFDMMMHYPFENTFQQINYEATLLKKEKRGVSMIDEVVKRFEELKNRVDAMPENPYINFALEEELIRIAKKALDDKKTRKNKFLDIFRFWKD